MSRAGDANAVRWCCTCAYDGTPFSGWQSQPDRNAIQDHLEARLQHVFGRLIRVHGSGRTDAGVHARGQVFHFDAAWRHGPEKLLKAMRVSLPREIQLRALEEVGMGFHARFSASGKRYRYTLDQGDPDPFERRYTWAYGRPLELAAMRKASKLLEGEHDFRAFSAIGGAPREDTVRTITRLELIENGSQVAIVAQADGFLYKMVRTLVGALVAVGEGKLGLDELKEQLGGVARRPVVFTAPPLGLCLEHVFYPKGAKKRRTPKDAPESEGPETD